MGKTGVIIKGMDENDAKTIVRTFSTREDYLRNLIVTYVPSNTRESVGEMDYARLRYFGYVIEGVANKILKGKLQKNKLEQLSLFS